MRKPEVLASIPAPSADPVVDFFDRRARQYDREYDHLTPGGYALRIRRKKVMQLFDKPGGKVLDVGCGPGIMADEMKRQGCVFWGVDPSQEMIRICRERFAAAAGIHFFCGDAMSLSLSDSTFDAVICMGVVDALSDRNAAVREMLRVLKPGGTLIITFANRQSPYAWWKNHIFYPAVYVWHSLLSKIGHLGSATKRRNGGATRTLYSRRQAIELVESEGAQVVHSTGYYYNLFISPLDELMPSFALWVTRKLEEGFPKKAAWLPVGLIVKARKL